MTSGLTRSVATAVRTVTWLQRRYFRSSWACRKLELQYETDRYNGVLVNLAQIPRDLSNREFDSILTDSLARWRGDKKSSVWLKVPLSLSCFISVAGDHGFRYHHAEDTSAMLKLWLDDSREDVTPQFATHQVGVSGCVVREDVNQLLVVQDKWRRNPLWKFPGGLAELGEDISDTAIREVYEETGIETQFVSILAFRQQHQQPGAFGRSDIYVICRLKPLSFDINPCSVEIRKCEWMDLDKLRHEVTAAPLTLRLVDLVRFGQEEGYGNIDICGEQMLSVYKGLKYRLYHRPVPEKWKLPADSPVVHSISPVPHSV